MEEGTCVWTTSDDEGNTRFRYRRMVRSLRMYVRSQRRLNNNNTYKFVDDKEDRQIR